MQYFKNSTGKNSKFPKLSDRVSYFKESKKGADAMTQIVEEYANKKVLERDKETARLFLQNGASVELVKKSIPTLSAEFIENSVAFSQISFPSTFCISQHPIHAISCLLPQFSNRYPLLLFYLYIPSMSPCQPIFHSKRNS